MAAISKAELLAATPANRRAWVKSFLWHAKTPDDAQRVWDILRRKGFTIGPLIATPWLKSPPSNISTMGERASAAIALKEEARQ